MSENKILTALRQLDPTNDNHWTTAGESRIETVKMLSGDATLTRDSIEQSVPGFNRSTAATYKAPGEESAGVQGGAPAPEIVVTEGLNVDNETLPTADPLPTAPPADGSFMEGEPTAPEGSEKQPGSVDAEDVVDAPKGGEGQMPPEIAQGTTMQGVNNLATTASDLVDALASTATSPNAPESLGGPLPDDSRGRAADITSDESEAQLEALASGDDGSDAIEALEAKLEKQEAKSERLRAAVDQQNALLSESVSTESDLRRQIAVLTPRGNSMVAVQGYFAAQDAAAEADAAKRAELIASGIDLKELNRLSSNLAPIDQAAADANKAASARR